MRCRNVLRLKFCKNWRKNILAYFLCRCISNWNEPTCWTQWRPLFLPMPLLSCVPLTTARTRVGMLWSNFVFFFASNRTDAHYIDDITALPWQISKEKTRDVLFGILYEKENIALSALNMCSNVRMSNEIEFQQHCLRQERRKVNFGWNENFLLVLICPVECSVVYWEKRWQWQ